MHGSHVGEDEPMAEMNLIPLIDIALTLLIIMMVTSAFVRQPGVSLKLPESATREGSPETPKDLTIVVAADGGLYVDGKKTEPAIVQGQLRTMHAKDPMSRVLIKGDRLAAYDGVMNVMDMVRQAGLTKIVLPTEPKGPGMATPPAPTAPAQPGGASPAGPAGPTGTAPNVTSPTGSAPPTVGSTAPPGPNVVGGNGPRSAVTGP